ncbi:MAG: class I SAM-dependent methyltransferase [Rhodoglobus sp.]
MSIPHIGHTGTVVESFGTGGAEPYGRALVRSGGGELLLRAVGEWPSMVMDVGDWLRCATQADLTALDNSQGPLLDVGCGPGRMVRAAADRGMPALGIDVSGRAVQHTRSEGSMALERSIFDRVPLEGRWRTILLMDGNVGIGGDPLALLMRCRDLLAEGGSIVVELDGEAEVNDRAMYTVLDREGNESAPFPWARVGAGAVERIASGSGLVVIDRWDVDARHFVRLSRA